MTFRRKLLTLVLTFGLLNTALASTQEAILGIGKGMDETLIQSKSISDAEQWEISWSWDLEQSFEGDYGYAEWWIQAGYMEFSGEHQGASDKLTLYQIKPILRLYPSGKEDSFFIEAGLGAAKLSKKSFEQIVIQTQGNFVIHAALGWTIGDSNKLSLRYSHFSNGYTHTPNPGIDSLAINYHWSFE